MPEGGKGEALAKDWRWTVTPYRQTANGSADPESETLSFARAKQHAYEQQRREWGEAIGLPPRRWDNPKDWKGPTP